jgi:hypothetical protein
LPQAFPPRKSERAKPDIQTRQASREELGKTLNGINPVGYLRKELSGRGVTSKVGLVPAILAAQELSKQPRGEILCTGEVKTYKGVYVERLTSDRCRDCQ